MNIYRLGKKPPKIDPRTLKLSRYIKAVPLPAAEVSWVTHINNWPLYLNDQLGDCVVAGAAHCIEQWLLYSNPTGFSPGVTEPGDNDVLTAYEAVSGYRPSDPYSDNGCNMLDFLNYWRKKGVGGHRIAAYAAIDFTNLTEVAQAIWLFGSAYIGVALPANIRGANAWTVQKGGIYTPDGAPGSWGGHCVMCPALSPETITCITWGEVLKMSHNFWLDYVEEAYAVLSYEWVEKSGYAPSGFDLATLQADLAALPPPPIGNDWRR